MNFLGLETVRWAGGLPREGVGLKSSLPPLKVRSLPSRAEAQHQRFENLAKASRRKIVSQSLLGVFSSLGTPQPILEVLFLRGSAILSESEMVVLLNHCTSVSTRAPSHARLLLVSSLIRSHSGTLAIKAEHPPQRDHPFY